MLTMSHVGLHVGVGLEPTGEERLRSRLSRFFLLGDTSLAGRRGEEETEPGRFTGSGFAPALQSSNMGPRRKCCQSCLGRDSEMIGKHANVTRKTAGSGARGDA